METAMKMKPFAVSYVRVSTKSQAEKDGDPDGYSIPAQLEANRRKAESMGAVIVEEFVDRGESARSADRPELQRMLEFVRHNPITMCIVHKVDRLARNRADDVQINLALQQSGAKLVSATENIDETPSGHLLHGIMSSIAEFYSRNLAGEVVKGMSQKAKTGGTPGRAPLGYRNVGRINEDGREVRTVEIDAERAPHIIWAFEAYASGTWTLRDLLVELETRGLVTRPTPGRVGKPVLKSHLHRMLTNPYYKGVVQFQGGEFEGRHPALVSSALWQQVQDMLESRGRAEKARTQNPIT
jgi:DNA invertase Pin-like site-specific DNA recombinase